MKIKTYVIIAIFLLIGAIAILDYSHSPHQAMERPAAQAGQVAPDFAPDFAFTPLGQSASMQLHDLRGKVVLINFWATWCPPCILELPLLVDLATRHPDQFVLLLVSADQNAQTVQEFLAKQTNYRDTLENAANIHVVWDEKKHISRGLYQTIRFPESILIGPDLSMQEKIAGIVDIEEVEEKIEKMTHKMQGRD